MSQKVAKPSRAREYEKMPKTGDVLGLKIHITSYGGVLEMVRKWLETGRKRARFVVTAYSETALEVRDDPEFGRSVAVADLVVADGVGIVAALDYARRVHTISGAGGWRWMRLIGEGWVTGSKIVGGRLGGQTVVGVKMVYRLVEEAARQGWRVMLVGGWQGVGIEAARRLFEGVGVVAKSGFDVVAVEGPSEIEIARRSVLEKLVGQINTYSPDVLLVSFGRFRQEKWIASNLKRLRVGVVMGVGSAFDEIAQGGAWSREIPGWVERRGFKWLWRSFGDWGHLRRAWRAGVVFPWRVFVDSFKPQV